MTRDRSEAYGKMVFAHDRNLLEQDLPADRWPSSYYSFSLFHLLPFAFDCDPKNPSDATKCDRHSSIWYPSLCCCCSLCAHTDLSERSSKKTASSDSQHSSAVEPANVSACGLFTILSGHQNMSHVPSQHCAAELPRMLSAPGFSFMPVGHSNRHPWLQVTAVHVCSQHASREKPETLEL